MAIVTETLSEFNPETRATQIVVWANLKNGDTGNPVKLPSHPEKTLHLTGALGAGGQMDFEGSNEATPTNWFILTQGGELAASLIALGGAYVIENPLWVRPKIPAGDGTTDLTLIMTASPG